MIQKLDVIWRLTESVFNHTPTPRRLKNDVLFRQAFYFTAKAIMPDLTYERLGRFAGRRLKKNNYNHATVFYALDEANNNFVLRDRMSVEWSNKVTKLITASRRACGVIDRQIITMQDFGERYNRQSASRSIQAHRVIVPNHLTNRQKLIRCTR